MSTLYLLSDLDLSIVPLFIGIALLLVCSGLISASETSFFSLSPQQLQSCKASHSTNEKQIIRLLENPNLLLATILMLNNFVNVGIVTISVYITWEIFGRNNPTAIFYSSTIATVLIVFFGEIFPKVIASRYNLQFARKASTVIGTIIFLTRPLTYILMGLGEMLEKRVKRVGYRITADELAEALEMATNQHPTSEGEKEILKGIITYGSKTVKQIMTPRMDMAVFDIDMRFHKLLNDINRLGYSRIPVYRETVDHIEGILYIKDLLPHVDKGDDFQWQELIRRDTLFVLENKKIDDLFREFQKRRVHIAIVVDEYGGTSGLITLEDILEEIIGDINDEFDDDNEALYKQIDENTYTFDAKISINDFCKIFDLDIEYLDGVYGEAHTLGGLVIELFAGLPAPGQRIRYKGFEFVVVSADKKRLKVIKCTYHADYN